MLTSFKQTLTGSVIPIIVGFLCIPFLLENLGEEMFGMLVIVWSIMGYSAIIDLGIAKSVVNKISKLDGSDQLEQSSVYIWSAVLGQLIIGSTLGFLIFALSEFIKVDMLNCSACSNQVVWIYMAISIPIMQISATFRGYLEGRHFFLMMNIIRAPLTSLMYLGPVIVLLNDGTFDEIVLFILALKLLTLVVFFFSTVFLDKRLLKIKFDFGAFKEMMSYGSWIMAGNIANAIMGVVDKLIIASVIGLSFVTYYAIPFEIILKTLIISGSLMTVMFPFVSKLSTELNNSKVEKIIKESTNNIFLFYGIVALILVVFGEALLDFWVGLEVATASSSVLIILSIGLIFNSLAYIPLTIHQAKGNPKIPAIGNLVELPIYVVLLYYLLEVFGVEGAAYAWTIRVIFDYFYLQIMQSIKYKMLFMVIDTPILIFIVSLYYVNELVLYLFYNYLSISNSTAVTALSIATFCVEIYVAYHIFIKDKKHENT